MMDAPFDPLFAAAVHDAKNALLVLDTQLAEAERRPTSADFAQTRATVARIAGQLAELLTLFRAQNGQLRLAIDDHDLGDFLDDVRSELGPFPAGIALTLDAGPAATLGVWAFDAYLVKLALLDALRNALRHARTRIALVLSQPAEGGICFSVSDDGPGFPQDALGGADSVASGTGTGLGLGFARLIATRHATPSGRHGHVECINTPGATLRIFLP
jgi:signal transduction histidine kinase